MASIQIERIAYAGWANCYRLSNGEVELIVTADVGPRVIHCGFVGGQNLFATFESDLGQSGESGWKARGGHRLWIAPEIWPDTYALDNRAVDVTVGDGSIRMLQPVEPETNLQKEISIQLTPDGEAILTHRIQNEGSEPRQLAPWTLTQMAPGGLGITRFPPRATHEQQLQPTNPLVMWAYTDFSDRRWCFTKKYLGLNQDPNNPDAQKAGLFNVNTLGAYLLGTDLFTKRSTAVLNQPYADFHSSFEIFANRDFLELETLGPLVSLAPGDSVEHVERWALYRDVKINAFTDEELDRVLPNT